MVLGIQKFNHLRGSCNSARKLDNDISTCCHYPTAKSMDHIINWDEKISRDWSPVWGWRFSLSTLDLACERSVSRSKRKVRVRTRTTRHPQTSEVLLSTRDLWGYWTPYTNIYQWLICGKMFLKWFLFEALTRFCVGNSDWRVQTWNTSSRKRICQRSCTISEVPNDERPLQKSSYVKTLKWCSETYIGSLFKNGKDDTWVQRDLLLLLLL